jgi:hypothetical protein
MNTLAVWGIGAAVAAVVTVGAIAGSDDEDRGTGHVIPTLGPIAGYRHVALPVTAPPDGALVHVTQSGDFDEHGEQVAFQYNGYSIDVCTVSRTRAEPTACQAQPGEGSSVVRTFRNGDYVTRVFAYGKFGEPAVGSISEAVALFRTAALAERPSWLDDYAKRNNERLAG